MKFFISEVAPDPEVRNVEPPRAPNPWEKTVEANKAKKKATASQAKKSKGFYSEESSGSSDGSGSSSGSESSGSSGSESESENEVVKKDNNTLLLGMYTRGLNVYKHHYR